MSSETFDWDERIVVFEGEAYEGKWPPDELLAFSAWVAEQVAKVPEEHRAQAKFDISSSSRYDCDYATLEIYYYRPPTPAEIAARMKDAAARRAKDITDAERRLAKLKGEA